MATVSNRSKQKGADLFIIERYENSKRTIQEEVPSDGNYSPNLPNQANNGDARKDSRVETSAACDAIDSTLLRQHSRTATDHVPQSLNNDKQQHKQTQEGSECDIQHSSQGQTMGTCNNSTAATQPVTVINNDRSSEPVTKHMEYFKRTIGQGTTSSTRR